MAARRYCRDRVEIAEITFHVGRPRSAAPTVKPNRLTERAGVDERESLRTFGYVGGYNLDAVTAGLRGL